MRTFDKGGSLVRRFAENRDGNFMVLTGIVLAAITMAVGLSVDTAQSYHVKSSLHSALDAAVTSTAYDITTGKIPIGAAQASVEKFLGINGRGVFTTEGYTLLPVVVDRNARTIEATAYAHVDLAFPFFGNDDPRVTVTSAALYSDKQIEVAMMLDVTGSMKKVGKMDKIGDLKKAAENAVKTMLDGQDPKKPRIRVALVPYASGVNVGGLAKNVFFEKTSGPNLPPLNDDPIIKAATGTTELPPYSQYQQIVAANYGSPGGNKCATERKRVDGTADLTADAPETMRTIRKNNKDKQYYALINRDDRLSTSGMNTCPDAEVIPLTADADALLESIEDFEANGFTGGSIAIQWTYYMLSSKWRNTIKNADLGNGPADYNPRAISKVAILMTDGQFNTAFAGVSGDDNNSQGDLARQNAVSLCKNMRDDNIEIFTIGFDLNNQKMSNGERDAAKKVLRDCASTRPSNTKHYYEVSTGEELDAAFQAIIANTEKIALTK